MVSSVIVGATRPEQVDENAAGADVEVDDELLAGVDELLAPYAITGEDDDG